VPEHIGTLYFLVVKNSSYLEGTLLVYGLTVLSIKLPNPSLKSEVNCLILSSRLLPRLCKVSLTFFIEYERSSR